MRQGSRGNIKVSDTTPQQTAKIPKEGSRLRVAYDLFVTNPGVVVPYATVHGAPHNELIQLRDFYGLDIRKTKNPRERILVGMYKSNGDYVDLRSRG